MSITILAKEPELLLCYGLSLYEFNCKCDKCVATIVDSSLLDAYQKLRTHLDKPITITCGYRCPPHNSEIGGVKLSRHQTGEALDMLLSSLRHIGNDSKIIDMLKQSGFKYIEINEQRGYVHADTRSS